VTPLDLLQLAAQFGLLSLLSVGGYVTVLPDVHRQLVITRGLLDDASFAQAVALGQASPGPNIIVIGVLGYAAAGPWGLVACLGGILLPSTLLVVYAGRWARGHAEHWALRAFKAGTPPLLVGLTAASAWLLALPTVSQSLEHWPRNLGAVALLAAVAMGCQRWPMLPPVAWLLAGAVAGVAGWV
jgi:chromate transporter